MKMIMAFVRSDYCKDICRRVVDEGAKGLTLSRTRGMGQGLKWARIDSLGHTRLEIIVDDKDVDRIIDVLIDAAWTGLPGDGIVLVYPLDRVVRIRTREEFGLKKASAGDSGESPSPSGA